VPWQQEKPNTLGCTNINIDRRLRAELIPLSLALARLLPV